MGPLDDRDRHPGVPRPPAAGWGLTPTPRQRTPLLLAWTGAGTRGLPSPLRLLVPPGLACLRQNASTIFAEADPRPAALERIAATGPDRVLCLFDVDGLAAALPACRFLADRSRGLVAVRGRVIPADAVGCFAEIAFVPRLLDLLDELGIALPARPVHPVVPAEARGANGAAPLGAVFSRIPDPGCLGLADVGRWPVREGASEPVLDVRLTPADLPALLAAHDRADLPAVLLVDAGGDAADLAAALLACGRLGAWFGPGHRPVPDAVVRRGVPVYTWFEPEDFAAPDAVPAGLRPGQGCAFVPVGLLGEDVPAATVRLLDLRARGYGTIVPRFHVPIPNTREWRALAAACGPTVVDPTALDGSRRVFRVPGYEPADGPELLHAWAKGNVAPPAPPAPAAPPPVRRRSLGDVREVLDDYLAGCAAGPALVHAADLMAALRAELGPRAEALEPAEDYPFVRWRGRDPRVLVDEALDARLRSLDGVPEALLRAMQHAVLGGGKRIRPVLAWTLLAAFEVPPDVALPLALAPEWLHAASLVQDDLPGMDDDPVRRSQAATHARYGEGLALLASDALVALAIEDVAGLAEHPRVGPARAAAMVRRIAVAIGPAGLVGGQARDLAARGTTLDLQGVLAIHRHKTAPLFALAAALPVLAADVAPAEAARLEDLLGRMGLAFQLVDDALDRTPGAAEFGRPAGSDARNRRVTAATLLGSDGARRHAGQLLGPAEALGAYPGLGALAQFILARAR